MDVSPYRRAYFALCKSFGLDADTRHDFNHAQTGKRSTSDFSVDDWRIVVAELQRRAGQNTQPGRPRIRGVRTAECGMRNASISPAQLEFIVKLAGEIPWTISAEAFVRARLLNQFRKPVWSGKWEDLFRSEAATVITALKRMADSSAVASAKADAQPPSALSASPRETVLPSSPKGTAHV